MWVTTKDGRRVNTDWFDKDRQIAENKKEADERNGKYTPVYHGTTYESALAILQSNELRGNVSNETETYGVSTTRNKHSAYDTVRLALDKDKLKENYSVKPVYRESVFGRDLAEERIDKTVKNVDRYIREIQWNDDSRSNIHLMFLRRRLVENFNNSENYCSFATKFLIKI